VFVECIVVFVECMRTLNLRGLRSLERALRSRSVSSGTSAREFDSGAREFESRERELHSRYVNYVVPT